MAKRKKRGYTASVIFVCLILLVLVFVLCFESVEKLFYPLEYEELIKTCSTEYGVPPELLAAVIFNESSFRSDAVSSKGAVGLMQIMPDTFDWLSRLMGDEFPGGERTDPETSVRCGSFYLRFMKDKYGSWETAVAGYHAGHNIVVKWLQDESLSDDGVNLKSIPYDSTATYVGRVLKSRDIYKKLYFSEENND